MINIILYMLESLTEQMTCNFSQTIRLSNAGLKKLVLRTLLILQFSPCGILPYLREDESLIRLPLGSDLIVTSLHTFENLSCFASQTFAVLSDQVPFLGDQTLQLNESGRLPRFLVLQLLLFETRLLQ